MDDPGKDSHSIAPANAAFNQHRALRPFPNGDGPHPCPRESYQSIHNTVLSPPRSSSPVLRCCPLEQMQRPLPSLIYLLSHVAMPHKHLGGLSSGGPAAGLRRPDLNAGGRCCGDQTEPSGLATERLAWHLSRPPAHTAHWQLWRRENARSSWVSMICPCLLKQELGRVKGRSWHKPHQRGSPQKLSNLPGNHSSQNGRFQASIPAFSRRRYRPVVCEYSF